MPAPIPRRTFISAVPLFGIAAASGSLGASPSRRLDRRRLLEYQDPDGSIRAIESVSQWQRRRDAIVNAMLEIMGSLPGPERRADLEVQLIEEADAGSYVRRLITYQSEPGCRTPAFLCVPKKLLDGSGRAAGVLSLHPTDNQIGHRVVMGLGGRPGRAYGAELAERGYVTISPSYPLLADYQPELTPLGYESGTMKAIWDNVRALDLLASLPFVDPARGFAAIGHSLGGHNAIYTAVLEPRIRIVVTSCGFDSYLDYYGGDESRWQPGAGWCQERYMPRLAEYRGRLNELPFDFPELIAALAPRGVFINAPLHDTNFRHDSVDACVDAARPVYELLGKPEGIRLLHPDCGHDFPDEIRQQAYAAIDSVLQG